MLRLLIPHALSFIFFLLLVYLLIIETRTCHCKHLRSDDWPLYQYNISVF